MEQQLLLMKHQIILGTRVNIMRNVTLVIMLIIKALLRQAVQ